MLKHTPDELRTAAALVAAAIGVLICVHRRHFILVASDPSSVFTMMDHRCGLCLLASLCWLLVESANLIIRSTKAQSVEPIR